MWPLYVFLAFLLIVIIIVISNVKMVPQAYAYVMERFGAYSKTWSTGLHVKIPFIDRIAKRVSLKEQVIDFPPQPAFFCFRGRSLRVREWSSREKGRCL